MRKILLVGLLILSGSLPLRAQGGFTTVSAVVVDASNNPYINCRGSAAFVPSPTATTFPTLSGSTFQTDVPISACDSFGAFTLSLADNALVSDGHTGGTASQWRIALCSATTPQVCFSATLTITGATQNISAALKAAAAPLPVVTNPASLSGNNAFTGLNTDSQVHAFNGGLTTTTAIASGLITANAGITSAGPNTLNGNNIAATIGPSAGQQHTLPAVASGNVAVLPTVTTTETGSGAVVKAISPGITTATLTGPTGGLVPREQGFSSSGTFTIPSGVTALKITVVGAGGGGGGGTSATLPGGGGAGGGTSVKWLSGLTPGNTLTVTVGVGGTASLGANGGTGGSSSVSSGTQTITTITSTGGSGGQSGANNHGAGGALPGVATGSLDLNLMGSGGTFGFNTVGGTGGGSAFGGGGTGSDLGTGIAGSNGGGGGGGGGSAGSTTGGVGGTGFVFFEWVN